MVESALSYVSRKAIPLAQRSAAAAAITASYTQVGANFGVGVVQIILVSTLDQTIQFSWDGVTDAFPVPIGATLVLDMKSNEAIIPGDKGVWVKRIGVPASGSLYVGGFTV